MHVASEKSEADERVLAIRQQNGVLQHEAMNSPPLRANRQSSVTPMRRDRDTVRSGDGCGVGTQRAGNHVLEVIDRVDSGAGVRKVKSTWAHASAELRLVVGPAGRIHHRGGLVL